MYLYVLYIAYYRMSSFCESGNDDVWMVHPTKYDVLEVAVVTMPDGGTWPGTQDHSKWVSTCIFVSTILL
jgi:hypothetical protein